MSALDKLVRIASEPLCPPLGQDVPLRDWGLLGDQLLTFLRQKNGFYAFESALLLRPLDNDEAPLGLLQWNQPRLWKDEYIERLDDALFFAEDVFGCQFAIRHGEIWFFDPEWGTFESIASSLEQWASEIVGDYHSQTGYPLAHQWQVRHGALQPGVRLLPKMMFALAATTYSRTSTRSMTSRGCASAHPSPTKSVICRTAPRSDSGSISATGHLASPQLTCPANCLDAGSGPQLLCRPILPPPLLAAIACARASLGDAPWPAS